MEPMVQKLQSMLYPHQREAIENLSNGKILVGAVGVGKSLTAIGYYLLKEQLTDVIVITTANKRDKLDWQRDFARFGISTQEPGPFGGQLTVDSWNNVSKYEDREGTFFIFDEQRVVGSGAWVKAFQRIARRNRWILLSATPGDTWLDYVPVFVANGLFRNAAEFKREHVQYAPYSKYPRIVKYLEVQTLEKYRNMLLVEMPYDKHTERIKIDVMCTFDEELMSKVVKKRWHVYENRPLTDAAEMFRVMRRVVNSDLSRLSSLETIVSNHSRVVVFYNFDYELEILRHHLASKGINWAEWNGHKHEPVPETDVWVYLTQYRAGAEGWNCTTSDAMVFYSLTYSYRDFEQSMGRIDRLNTPFSKLYYYIFLSNSQIDKSIRNAIRHKKIFNEGAWVRANMPPDQVFSEDELDKKYAKI